jgi:hypothetical protein
MFCGYKVILESTLTWSFLAVKLGMEWQVRKKAVVHKQKNIGDQTSVN